MINDLLLLSSNDIPFPQAQLIMHQPTIKEIAFIGEEAFFSGCEMVNFSKNILSEEDKINLEDKSNFDILIAILRERNAVMQKRRDCLQMLLALIFPEYTIKFNIKNIELRKIEEDESHYIDNSNFEDFRIIINHMFAFNKEDLQEYNPSGGLAKKIADKLNKRHQKLAETKNDNKKIDILSRYVSILSVGEGKDMNSLLNYTVYQLFDEFERFQLKVQNDIYIKAKMAGAKDLKDIEDWMKDIHS